MLEAALFLVLAILITKTRTWNKGPRLRDTIQFKAVFMSMFDAGPLRLVDEEDEQGTEDPNSNPHYIWYEQSQSE